MPDDWENANDLNPYEGNDAQLKTVDGVYPNIEVYINSLVADIVSAQNEEGIATAVREIGIDKPADNILNMYFNNAEHKLVVSHSERISNVRIYSITGQMLVNQKFNQEDLILDVPFLKPGIYIVSVRDTQNRTFAKKMVKH
jgi:hypothetical protein